MAATKIIAAVAALTSISCVAALPDPMSYLSYGDCYYKTNEEADSTYIPMGNSTYGHFSCCQAGDKFNANNVCVHTESTFTYSYLAGCTDSSYQDGACPYKGNHSDYQWVGLVNCGDLDNDDLTAWVGCDNDGYKTVRKSDKSEGCTCTLSGQIQDEVLFRAPRSLTAFGVLPMIEGANGTWLSGWDPAQLLSSAAAATTGAMETVRGVVPTTTRPLSTTSTRLSSILRISDSSSSSSSSSVTQTQTSTVTSTSTDVAVAPLSQGPDDIAPGAIAGATVGVLIGCSLLVVAAFAFRRYRNRENSTFSISGYDEKSHASTTPEDSIVKGYNEADSRSPTIAKFELPGSPATTFEADSSHVSSPKSSIPSSPGGTEQVYRPLRYQPSTQLQDIPEMPTRSSRVESGSESYISFRYPAKEQELAFAQGSLAELPG